MSLFQFYVIMKTLGPVFAAVSRQTIAFALPLIILLCLQAIYDSANM